MITPSNQFHSAAAFLSSSEQASKASNPIKLQIYGLYKYLTVSPRPQSARPGIFDWTGSAKWDAWSKVYDTYGLDKSAEAELAYLSIARSMGWQLPNHEEPIQVHGNQENQGTGLGGSVSAPSKPEEIPDHSIHGCALSEESGSLAALLDSGDTIDIDALDEYGFSPLHLAVDRGRLENVRLLIEKGANPNILDTDGHTAYQLAEIAEREDILEFLRQDLKTVSQPRLA